MFEDYKRRINKAFGEYELKMIALSESLMNEASCLDNLAYSCWDVAYECSMVAENLKSFALILEQGADQPDDSKGRVAG